MFRTTRIHIRLAQGIAVVVAAAALLVPAASAMRLITDTLAPGGTSASGSHFITDTLAPGGDRSDVVSRYIGSHVASVQQHSVRVITDTLAPGGGVPAAAVSPGADGIRWWDTGVGFLAALVLVGIVLARRFLLQRRSAVIA